MRRLLLTAGLLLALAGCTPDMNAYAGPRGVVVTSTLIDLVEHPTELAFIMGHELGHYIHGDIGKPRELWREIRADAFALETLIAAGHDVCIASAFMGRVDRALGGRKLSIARVRRLDAACAKTKQEEPR